MQRRTTCLEEFAQEVGVAEAPMPGLGGGGMIGHVAFEADAAEPAIGEIEMHLLAQALRLSEGIDGLSAAMRGLIGARAAVLEAVAAIDADMKKMVRASEACRRLMTIPGVGQLTALAFTAAVDDPARFKRCRDVGPYLGLVPRRYQSGEVDNTGSISKCGDRRVRTLLYEAANVMLTRYRPPLKLKTWATGHCAALDHAQSASR